MACEVWRQKLDAYADGELGQAESAELAVHLRQCARCASDVLARVQMKRAVAIAGKQLNAHEDFRERVRKSISIKSEKKATPMWRVLAAPALLVLALSVGVNWFVGHEKARRERVYSELADLHVATLASASPVDVVSTDRHTVKPWFQGRIPFTFNLPELQASDFELLGGRVTYLAQAPGAELLYRLRKHEISVFVFQDRGGPSGGLTSTPVQALSFHIESWTKNGLQFFVVGDVSTDDLDALGKLFRDAQ